MKTVIYAPIALWERHWAYAIEIAHHEHSLGNEVLIVNCTKALLSCAANPNHLVWRCNQCVHQSKTSRREHFPEGTQHISLSASDLYQVTKGIAIPKVKNSEEMYRFEYDGFRFGSNVMSHLISIHREQVIADKIIQSVGQSLLINSISMYESLLLALPGDIKKVFMWGGRRPSESPMMYVAQKRDTELVYFEEGSLPTRYITTTESLWEFASTNKSIRDWEKIRMKRDNISTIIEEGATFFSDRREGKSKEPNFVWFMRGFEGVPKAKLSEKLNLGFFTSSQWEIAENELENLNNPFIDFVDQFSTLTRTLKSDFILNAFEVVIRWHPNHSNAGQLERERIDQIVDDFTNVTHIKYSDKFDSYRVIESCDVVIVFGSTIGIEAAFMGKPTVLLGGAAYSDLGSVYEPRDFKEFQALMESNLNPLPKYGALLFGDYMKNRGIDLKYVTNEEDKFYVQGRRIKSSSVFVRARFLFGAIKRRALRFVKSN